MYDVALVIGRVFDYRKQDMAKMVDTALDLSNGLVIISNGKEYVRSHANKDAVNGIATDPRVAKWLGTKGL